jgi:hypothetical protein
MASSPEAELAGMIGQDEATAKNYLEVKPCPCLCAADLWKQAIISLLL